jgi:hypothetical protein
MFVAMRGMYQEEFCDHQASVCSLDIIKVRDKKKNLPCGDVLLDESHTTFGAILTNPNEQRSIQGLVKKLANDNVKPNAKKLPRQINDPATRNVSSVLRSGAQRQTVVTIFSLWQKPEKSFHYIYFKAVLNFERIRNYE